jgi:hypothetical protein
LSALEAGAAGRLVGVSNGDPEMSRYLDDYRIAPGDRIEVLCGGRLTGWLRVRVGECRDGRIHILGYQLARALLVEIDL